MFKQEPAADSLLFGRIVEQAAVDEVLVDGSKDETAARQEFPEIGVTGIREVRHVVIAVNDERQRKWPRALRVPDAGVQRKLVDIKAPVFFSRPALPALEVLKKVRCVNAVSLDCYAGT